MNKEKTGKSMDELLTGKNFKTKAITDKNLTTQKNIEEICSNRLLKIERVTGLLCTAAFLVLILASAFAVEQTVWSVVMAVTGSLILAAGIILCLRIEQTAGYYECPDCGKRYVPTMKAVVLAPHFGLSRIMKCPDCGKFRLHRKVLTR